VFEPPNASARSAKSSVKSIGTSNVVTMTAVSTPSTVS
jgi:hypothetical protein